ncbi:asparagine synthetase B [Prolixibacter sp. NT017]|uniref:asparagine synthetase B n=1 Tax=Prolixibacter sp. NT017 TaxID=2652390 RepID=UPI001281013D|nr:asparagine synthetase B [Prolixibacter sp. NT017]GET26728.1 hypothetical protein NT017_30570 [Prolixibacter sp. NT017]
MKRIFSLVTLLFILVVKAHAAFLLIPMDDQQKNHLKAYGVVYWALQQDVEVKWLLNYRGGSFLMPSNRNVHDECLIRGVSVETIPDAKASSILQYIAREDVNMDAVAMQKAPKIAVYSPPNKQPWDDAVTLVLSYAEIPYDVVYDQEILDGKLKNYDWLHLHHEDFTGEFGKFYRNYHNMPWYQEEVRVNREMAEKNGFQKVSKLKLKVAEIIKNFVKNGGFLFAMCAATDTYDIALAAHNTDICGPMYDGDPEDPDMDSKLDFGNTLAFQNFHIVKDPYAYEFSDIDVTETRKVKPEDDYFTLFDYSAKWDPVPTMLTQDHTRIIKGFMGQTTAFNEDKLKANILIMGENKAAHEARYIHGDYGKGFFSFYGGHDPEDYRHLVGDPPTDLSLHPNSPGYRLILNNVLFPAARKKKHKT